MANTPSSGGGGGGSGGGALGVRRITNPNFSGGGPVLIGGVELWTVEAEQSGGQDVPQEPLEGGYEVSGRNVLTPESGTLTGAVKSDGLGALKDLYRRQEPVSITTPEGRVAECFVDGVTRTRQGQFVDKFGVEVSWQQVFLAETGTTSVQAITADGKATGSSGGDGGQTFVQSDSGTGGTSGSGSGGDSTGSASGAGPTGELAGAGEGGLEPGEQVGEAGGVASPNINIGETLGNFADDIADWATGNDDNDNSNTNSSGGGE